ncbi:MAG: ATP-grasp domain-containing protein [Bacilli bacterium]|nr:ATP-grasp domain-containing protein [Bacilli bacterium]
MAKILLTGTRNPIAIDIIRNLAKNKHTSYTAESIDFDTGKLSKYTNKSFIVPSVRYQEKEYIQAIIRIINENNIEALICLGEEKLYLAKNKKELIKKCKNLNIIIEDINKLELLHNKYSFYKLVKELNIKTPNTKLVKTHSDILEYIKKYNKIILKPVYSRFASEIIIVDKNNIKTIENLSLERNYIMQEYIEGTSKCSLSIFKKNKEIVSLLYDSELIIRTGSLVSIRTIDMNKQITEIITKIVNKIKYDGVICFDFIETKKGEIYILECNPRLTTGITLLTKQFSIYDLLFTVENKVEYRKSKRKYSNMLFSCLFRGMIPINKWITFTKIIITYKDIIFDIKDIKPYFTYVYKFIKNIIKKNLEKSKYSIERYLTIDMEYNGDINEIQS